MGEKRKKKDFRISVSHHFSIWFASVGPDSRALIQNRCSFGWPWQLKNLDFPFEHEISSVQFCVWMATFRMTTPRNRHRFDIHFADVSPFNQTHNHSIHGFMRWRMTDSRQLKILTGKCWTWRRWNNSVIPVPRISSEIYIPLRCRSRKSLRIRIERYTSYPKITFIFNSKHFQSPLLFVFFSFSSFSVDSVRTILILCSHFNTFNFTAFLPT